MKFIAIIACLALLWGCAKPEHLPMISVDRFLSEVNPDRSQPVGVMGLLVKEEGAFHLVNGLRRIEVRSEDSSCLEMFAQSEVLIRFSPNDSYDELDRSINEFIFIQSVSDVSSEGDSVICDGLLDDPAWASSS
jgi:hypothetical protein